MPGHGCAPVLLFMATLVASPVGPPLQPENASLLAPPVAPPLPVSPPPPPPPPPEEPGPTYPLFLPDPHASTKLIVQQAGLDYLASIEGKVAIIAAIGPYRTGKSYLLNSLMGVSCTRGFGVGNLRSTNTQGIWLWGEPEVVNVGGEQISVVFMDTEGMEGTGRTSVYDDRIFALASLLSSVLVYNLPETVKESDIQKLSFAVELSEEFYRRLSNNKKKHQSGEETTQFAFPTLIWLIQRDFLEGEEVQQHIAEVVAPVENTQNDPNVEELNRIRKSLQVFEQIGTGLRQPHLDRTKLCELSDSDLDPRYIAQRDALKVTVRQKVSPKVIASVAVDGKGLADFVSKCGPALNDKDLPSVGSVIDVFNTNLVQRALAKYTELLEHPPGYAERQGSLKGAAGAETQQGLGETSAAQSPLPMSTDTLSAMHTAAQAAALELFMDEQFGEAGEAPVLAGIQKIYSAWAEKNKFASLTACDSVYNQCDNAVGLATEQYLLSRAKFEQTFRQCNTSFATKCVGPSLSVFQPRLDSSWSRSSARFARAYHERILGVVLTACLGGAIVFRFIIIQPLLELVCWLGLGVLEIVPRLTAISTMSTQDHSAIFKSSWWAYIVTGYELFVFNPLYDLSSEEHAETFLHGVFLFCVLWKIKDVACCRRLACCLLRPCLRRLFFCRCCSSCCGSVIERVGATADGGTDAEKVLADQLKASGTVGAQDDVAKVL